MTVYVYIPTESPTEAAWPATTERWGTSTYATAVTTDRACPVQDRAYKATQTGTSVFWAASWNALDSDGNRANVEVLTCWRDDDTGGAGWQSDFAVIVRGSGSSGSEAGYYFGGRVVNNEVRIGKLVAGAYTAIGTPVGKTLANNTWYWMRCRINSTSLWLRVWADGTTEPTSWDMSQTDSAISAAGWIGLSYARGAGSASGRFGCLSVATNGDTAVTPLTRAAWRTWLKADATERTVLAEVGMMDTATPVTKYLSSRAYGSQSWDAPSSQAYTPAIVTAPDWSQTASELIAGQTSIAISELVISNDSGVRDSWLKVNVDGRDVRLLLGAATWPRHDFRPLAIAVAEYVRTDGLGNLAIVLRDKQRLADRAISDNVIASGDSAGRPIPIVLGRALWVEPLALDSTTLEYQVHNGACLVINEAYDGGVIMTASATISSVNAGTDTITTTANHGMLPTYEVVFGTTAGNIIAGTIYYCITGTTGTAMKISATRGGAAKDLNGSETGTISGQGRAVDLTTGKLYLAQTPTSELRIISVAVGSDWTPAGLIKSVLVDYCGLTGYIDDQAMVASNASEVAGMYITERTNAVDVIDSLAGDLFGAWGVGRDGLYYLTEMLTGSGYTFTFTSADIVGGLNLDRVLMPIYTTQARMLRMQSPSTVFLAGALATDRERRGDTHYVVTKYTTNNGTDDQANHALAIKQSVFDSYSEDATAFITRLQAIRQRKAAIWSFETTLRALECRVGDVATITYPRYGFDSGLSGTIIAIRDNVAAQRVRLTVFVQNYSQAAAP